MWRIIDILKEIQQNQEFISLQYLIDKFHVTVRTIEKDIKFINSLLSKNSSCKIVKTKDKLKLVGKNKTKNIDKLIISFFKQSKDFNLIELYKLLLSFIFQKQYSFSKFDNYSLKQNIKLINNFSYYYQFNLKIVFKQKIGWVLQGNELDLRFIATNILINQSNYYFNEKEQHLEPSLIYLYNKLEQILLDNGYKDYLFNELTWFLVILIKRIKNGDILNKYYFNFNILTFTKQIINDINKLVNLLKKNFHLNINNYEIQYLKCVLFLNQKYVDLKIIKKN